MTELEEDGVSCPPALTCVAAGLAYPCSASLTAPPPPPPPLPLPDPERLLSDTPDPFPAAPDNNPPVGLAGVDETGDRRAAPALLLPDDAIGAFEGLPCIVEGGLEADVDVEASDAPGRGVVPDNVDEDEEVVVAAAAAGVEASPKAEEGD